MNNVLLVIVDCLRYDRVTPQFMPRLHEWGERHVSCTNYRVTSHCTDPSITHLLSGKHPDELGLYSMMYDDATFDLPDAVRMLPQLAAERGYTTGFLTNLGRWYKRGVQFYVDVTGWRVRPVMERAKEMARMLPHPWLIVVHTDAMHTDYEGGSYDVAAGLVDESLAELLAVAEDEQAVIVVTADHGEGLGQTSVSGLVVEQHGSCLDGFLTHVPLLICPGCYTCTKKVGNLLDNGSVHDYLCLVMAESEKSGRPYLKDKTHVFQAGATPDLFHRGVVYPDGSQFIVGHDLEKGVHKAFRITPGRLPDDFELAEELLKKHLAACGIDYATFDEQRVAARLRALGYFD